MAKNIEMNYLDSGGYEVLYPAVMVANIGDFQSYMQENYYNKEEINSLNQNSSSGRIIYSSIWNKAQLITLSDLENYNKIAIIGKMVLSNQDSYGSIRITASLEISGLSIFNCVIGGSRSTTSQGNAQMVFGNNVIGGLGLFSSNVTNSSATRNEINPFYANQQRNNNIQLIMDFQGGSGTTFGTTNVTCEFTIIGY